MCLAELYAESIMLTCDEAKKEYNELLSKLSKLDLEIQDILHILEFENFSASKGYMYAKQIKELRVKRRDIKKELAPLQSLINNFINKNIHQIKNLKSHVVTVSEKHAEVKPYKPKVANQIKEVS